MDQDVKSHRDIFHQRGLITVDRTSNKWFRIATLSKEIKNLISPLNVDFVSFSIGIVVDKIMSSVISLALEVPKIMSSGIDKITITVALFWHLCSIMKTLSIL